MTELYDQWLSEGIHQFTEGGNMKPPSRKRIIEWVLYVWSLLSKENITKSFKCWGLNLANDGTEDDFIHCLIKGQPGAAGKLQLNSHLSILVDKSDAVNPFISPSDEEDANEEIYVIKDEKDEEIIMWICNFFNRLSYVKKSYLSNTSNF